MKKLMFLLALLLVFPTAYAKQDDSEELHDLIIQQVFVDFEAVPPDYLLIRGEGFQTKCDEPVVVIEGLTSPLYVVTAFDYEILAELPDLADGNYGLTVSCKKKSDSFDFAIGAIGPVGPQGEPGPDGEQGEPGGAALAIWSGGCSHHGTLAGFNTYCTDSSDFSTSDGYLTVNPNGTFTVLEAGYYRINMWCISLGSGYGYIRLIVNGAYKHHGHQYVHGAWIDNFMDLTWKFNAGDSFYVEVWNPGSYAYHAYNSNGAHSRLQVTMEAPLE